MAEAANGGTHGFAFGGCGGVLGAPQGAGAEAAAAVGPMAVAFGAIRGVGGGGGCAPTAIRGGGGGCGGCRGLCSATDKALSARSCSSEAIRSKPWAITATAAAFAKTRSLASGMPAKMIDLTVDGATRASLRTFTAAAKSCR